MIVLREILTVDFKYPDDFVTIIVNLLHGVMEQISQGSR